MPYSFFPNIPGLHAGPEAFDKITVIHQTIYSPASEDADAQTDEDLPMGSFDGPFCDDDSSDARHPSMDSLETSSLTWNSGPNLLLETPASAKLSDIHSEKTDKVVDPTSHSLGSNGDDLFPSADEGRIVFSRRLFIQSPDFIRGGVISTWSSLYEVPMGLINVGLCSDSSEHTPADSARPEACIDPALVFPRPIYYATESDEDETEGEESSIYAACNKVNEQNDMHNEEDTDSVDNAETRDPTPALSLSASKSHSTYSPEPVTPSTPSLELGRHVIPLPASRPRVHKGKRRASEKKLRAASPVCDIAPPSHTLRKRKRTATKAEDESDFKNDESGDESPALTNQHGATSSDTKSGDYLSIDFILQRFDIAVPSDDEYPCPFLLGGSLGPACSGQFSVPRLKKHIIMHIKSFSGAYPNEHMPCPLRSAHGCKWLKEMYKPITISDPNQDLPRHIVEAHLKAATLHCPCGGTISRKCINNIRRHLRTDIHMSALAKKQKADRTFPKYPNLDDPRLVVEQARSVDNWEIVSYEADDEYEKGEGSSKGTKRRRSH